jgi:hypothetical protein
VLEIVSGRLSSVWFAYMLGRSQGPDVVSGEGACQTWPGGLFGEGTWVRVKVNESKA